MSDSVFIGSGNLIIKLLEEQGIEPKEFLESVFKKKLNFDLMHDPSARVAYKNLEIAWERFFEITGDECLGL